MTKDELHKTLLIQGIPEDAFSLADDGTRDECYVLSRSGSSWSVFYSERGLRTGEATYHSEADACEALLRRIIRDMGSDPDTFVDGLA